MFKQMIEVEMEGPEEEIDALMCVAGYAIDYEISDRAIDVSLMAYAVTMFDGELGFPGERDAAEERALAGPPHTIFLHHAELRRSGRSRRLVWQVSGDIVPVNEFVCLSAFFANTTIRLAYSLDVFDSTVSKKVELLAGQAQLCTDAG